MPKRKVGTLSEDGTVYIGKEHRYTISKATKATRRRMIVAYLGNPDNEWPSKRADYLPLVGLKPNRGYLRKMFSVKDVEEMEAEALELRRRGYGPRLAAVDNALFDVVTDKDSKKYGSGTESELIYKRFEGWSPVQRHEVESRSISIELRADLQDKIKEGLVRAGLLPESVPNAEVMTE
jgi:hypothetical protein